MPQGRGYRDETRGRLARITETNNKPDLEWSAHHDGVDEARLVSLVDISDGLMASGDSASFPDGSWNNALWLNRAPCEGYLSWIGSLGAGLPVRMT